MSATPLKTPAQQAHSAPQTPQGSAPNPGASTPTDVQIPEATLRKHYLSGEFFITAEAAQAHDIDEVLRWFNSPHEPVEAGDTRDIGHGLKAFFGFDDSKPPRKAFFVRIY